MGLGVGVVRADPDDLLTGTVQALDEAGEGVGTLATSGVRPTSFAVIGDYGTGTIVEARVAEMVRQWNPDFVVTVGDNNYGPLSPNPEDFDLPVTYWTRFVGAFYGQFIQRRGDGRYGEQTAVSQRFFPAVGNHDSLDGEEGGGFPTTGGNGGTIRGYLAYFHENPGGAARLPVDRGAMHTTDVSYYAVRRGPVDIFVLDSDAIHKPGLIDAQKSWLAGSVGSSDAQWKIAVFHQPPYTSSFRGGALWMRWGELRLLDAILCGHDHFYERLELDGDGPPMLIAGAGGQGLYAARDPVSESRFLNNTLHGGLFVRATDDGMTFEFRGLPAFAGDEQLVESFSLGKPVVDDFEDAYRFFAEAGQHMRVETRTPSPPGAAPLDLAVKITESQGLEILKATEGAPDGHNVQASAPVRSTGWHRLVVSAQAPGSGGYRVAVELIDLLGGLGGWTDRHFPFGGEPALPSSDIDADGLPNLVEYALALNPAASSIRSRRSGFSRTWKQRRPVPWSSKSMCLLPLLPTSVCNSRCRRTFLRRHGFAWRTSRGWATGRVPRRSQASGLRRTCGASR